MNERLVLMDGEKEKLVDEILDLLQRIKILQAELDAFKNKIPVTCDPSQPIFSYSHRCRGPRPHRFDFSGSDLLLQKRSVIPAIASAYLARRHGASNSTLFTSVC